MLFLPGHCVQYPESRNAADVSTASRHPLGLTICFLRITPQSPFMFSGICRWATEGGGEDLRGRYKCVLGPPGGTAGEACLDHCKEKGDQYKQYSHVKPRAGFEFRKPVFWIELGGNVIESINGSLLTFLLEFLYLCL